MNLKVSVRLNRNSECVEGETRLQSVKTAGSCRGSAVSRHLVCEEVEEGRGPRQAAGGACCGLSQVLVGCMRPEPADGPWGGAWCGGGGRGLEAPRCLPGANRCPGWIMRAGRRGTAVAR